MSKTEENKQKDLGRVRVDIQSAQDEILRLGGLIDLAQTRPQINELNNKRKAQLDRLADLQRAEAIIARSLEA